MEWVAEFIVRYRLPADYSEALESIVAPLAEDICRTRRQLGRPPLVGISGAQGSGKTTFALILGEWLERELGQSIACLSLDDLYLRKAQRRELARGVHPLLETRGVPGTHDVPRAVGLLDALTEPDRPRTLALPVFDKALDDRAPKDLWRTIEAPVDMVLFEGWCVGARPQPEESLVRHVNALEAGEDPAGEWRRYVNRRLASDYAALFARLDRLVMLRVPSFGRVFEWRSLQERRLREEPGAGGAESPARTGQSDAELVRFIQHYERLTRHMLDTMPSYAHAVIAIDHDHRMTGMTRRENAL